MTHKEPDPFEATAMRAMGEGDRSDEFKAEREKFITGVNGWLKTIADYRDGGHTLPDGRTITEDPRIVTTDLGRTPRGGRANAVHYKEGVSLTGDGVTSPLHLQAVTEKPGGVFEMVEVKGSDPAGKIYGEYTFKRQLEVVAQVSQHVSHPGGEVSEMAIDAWGDGNVKQHFMSLKGINTSVPVMNAEDMASASEAAIAIVREIA